MARAVEATIFSDAEAAPEVCVPSARRPEVRALLPLSPKEQQSAHGSKLRKVGLIAAGVGACVAIFGYAGRSAVAMVPFFNAFIQGNAWDGCDADWVIKKVVINNLRGEREGFRGLRFEVERHGGALPPGKFLLDATAPGIRDGDRSGDGEAHGSLWKLHLAHGHPLWIHFSLWDLKHKEQQTMQNFGIGFFDLDESKHNGHHEFIIAEPSLVAKVGDGLEMKTSESGKVKFQGITFGLGEDDPESTTELTESQQSKYVRLIYNNVKEFTVGFGWTNPENGIAREIAFTLHNPDHCKDPIAAPPLPEGVEEVTPKPEEAKELKNAQDHAHKAEEAEERAEFAADAAEADAKKAEAAKEKAEDQLKHAKHEAEMAEKAVDKVKDKLSDARHAQEKAEEKLDSALDHAIAAEKEQTKAEHKAKDVIEDAKHDEAVYHKRYREAEEEKKEAEHRLHVGLHKVALREKHVEMVITKAQGEQGKEEDRADAAQHTANLAAAHKRNAEDSLKMVREKLKAARKAEEAAIEDAEAARIDAAAMQEKRKKAEKKAKSAQADVKDAQGRFKDSIKTEDCAEKEAKVRNKYLGEEEKKLHKVQAEINDILKTKMANCPDCNY